MTMNTWTAASLIFLAAAIGLAGGLMLADRLDHPIRSGNEDSASACRYSFNSPLVEHCQNLQRTFSPYPTLRLHPLDPGRRLSFTRRLVDA